MDGQESAVVELRDVRVTRAGAALLADIDWRVERGERWAILGPNGSGKTTLVSVASTYLWPSEGTVTVLGSRIGEVDVRELRRRIGVVSATLAARIPGQLSATDVVVAGATGAIAPWWDRRTAAVSDRAVELLELVGCATVAGRPFGLLSSGEQQRVQIARALMPEPALLLLDEPAAGLDLGARETLALLLERLSADRGIAAIVVVTHHVEEIPPGTTHALVLRAGRIVAAGEAREVIRDRVLSAAFGLRLAVGRTGGRFHARAMAPPADTSAPPASGAPDAASGGGAASPKRRTSRGADPAAGR